jgi:multiple sugar transport system substrate-binding protein
VQSRWPALGVALLLTVLLAACGTPASPEPATIDFAYHTIGQGFSEPVYWEQLAEVFEERHPHLTINLRPGEFGGSDAFTLPSFLVQQLSSDQSILSLDVLIEEDPSFDLADYYPTALDMFTVGGELWAIPAGTVVTVMYYNQDLFDAYGVPYPEEGWTWDDFLDTARALRDPGSGVYGYVNRGDEIDVIGFVYQHGGRLVDDLDDPTRATFDDPLTVEALERYADLIYRYEVAPTPRQATREFGMGVDDYGIGVNNGQVAMWVGWIHERGLAGVPWEFNWGMVPLPRDARAATLAVGLGFAIASDVEDANVCWDWIAYLSEQRPEIVMPARISHVESREYGDRAESEVARAAMEDAMLVPYSVLSSWDGGTSLRVFGSALEKIVDGRATVQEALSLAQEQIE